MGNHCQTLDHCTKILKELRPIWLSSDYRSLLIFGAIMLLDDRLIARQRTASAVWD